VFLHPRLRCLVLAVVSGGDVKDKVPAERGRAGPELDQSRLHSARGAVAGEIGKRLGRALSFSVVDRDLVGGAGDGLHLFRLDDLNLECQALRHVLGLGVLVAIWGRAVSACDVRGDGQRRGPKAVGEAELQQRDEAQRRPELGPGGDVAQRRGEDLGRVPLQEGRARLVVLDVAAKGLAGLVARLGAAADDPVGANAASEVGHGAPRWEAGGVGRRLDGVGGVVPEGLCDRHLGHVSDDGRRERDGEGRKHVAAGLLDREVWNCFRDPLVHLRDRS